MSGIYANLDRYNEELESYTEIRTGWANSSNTDLLGYAGYCLSLGYGLQIILPYESHSPTESYITIRFRNGATWDTHTIKTTFEHKRN